MKKVVLAVILLVIVGSTNSTFAQTNTDTKSIVLTKHKGTKTLTITEVKDGKKQTQVFNNEEADAKIMEMEKRGGLKKTIIIGADGSQRIEIEES